MWALEKYMCKRLQNSIMLLGLDFMPLDQIANMSQNGLRKRVVTHDKTETETRMEKSLVALDMGHRVSSSGAPLLLFHILKKCLLHDLYE
jgi:hypothetical protein